MFPINSKSEPAAVAPSAVKNVRKIKKKYYSLTGSIRNVIGRKGGKQISKKRRSKAKKKDHIHIKKEKKMDDTIVMEEIEVEENGVKENLHSNIIVKEIMLHEKN